MRRRLLTLFAVAMTAITLLTPAFAGAAELEPGVILDESQYNAATDYHQQDGCVETFIHLSLSDAHQDWNDGTVYDHEIVGLFAYQEDICQENVIFNIEFYADTMPFKINPKLSGASVSGQAVANNIVGDDVAVSVAMMWTPQGPASATPYTDVIGVINPATGEEVLADMEMTDFYRQAQARGTITIGDQTFTISDRGDDTALFGFENTWTMQSE